MTNRSRSCCNRYRKALSLIEVVVGLSLLGGLLVSVVIATSRIAVQNRAVQQRRHAIDALDRLLVGLENRSIGLQGKQAGPIPDFAALEWRAVPIENSTNLALLTRQVKITVVDRQTGRALTSVELVVPLPSEVDFPKQEQP